eukprot:3101913-Rhodomonas_salina.2
MGLARRRRASEPRRVTVTRMRVWLLSVCARVFVSPQWHDSRIRILPPVSFTSSGVCCHHDPCDALRNASAAIGSPRLASAVTWRSSKEASRST